MVEHNGMTHNVMGQTSDRPTLWPATLSHESRAGLQRVDQAGSAGRAGNALRRRYGAMKAFSCRSCSKRLRRLTGQLDAVKVPTTRGAALVSMTVKKILDRAA
jgi:hypothetical protein